MTPYNQPVSAVQWVHHSLLEANDYNPNTVAPPEMRLLALSILEDGWTQPIVVAAKEDGRYEVIDGYHRYRTITENKRVQAMTDGHAPVVVLDKSREARMLSTIRHNRARGKHGVRPMTEIVAELAQAGLDDAAIGKRLGMQQDEVLRLKQASGLPEMFKGQPYSKAWT